MAARSRFLRAEYAVQCVRFRQRVRCFGLLTFGKDLHYHKGEFLAKVRRKNKHLVSHD